MPKKDLYEAMCRFYALILGALPMRDELRAVLEETVAEDDLRAFFLLPLSGPLPLEKLVRRARRKGLTEEQVRGMLDRLAAEGIVLAYEGKQGRAYERGNVVFFTEQQMRKLADCPRRTILARFFDQVMETSSRNLPTQTPYFRVLPAEATVPHKDASPRTVMVNEAIPDPRGVLPIDVVSEMVRQTWLIGVAECYCRKAMRILGQGCEHPLETCMVFNELADTLIHNGFARQLTYDEAMKIIWECEKQGLVHNVDNCQGEIRALCNCCACACAVLRTWQYGQHNAGAPSRYVVKFTPQKCTLDGACVSICPNGARKIENGYMVVDPAACVGCGLCVTTCPQNANRMVLREQPPHIPRTYFELYGKIGREALLGMVKRKVLGWKI